MRDAINEMRVENGEKPLTEEELFEALIEKIIVPGANLLKFVFKDGHTVDREWQDRSRSQSWTPEMKERARQKNLERRKLNEEVNNSNTGNEE